MTLVHPIYICTLDTEPLLVGQDLLGRLAPLIDCHQGQLWAQVETPKPLGTSSKPPSSTNRVSSVEGPKEPLAKLMPSTEPVSGTCGAQVHPATPGTALRGHDSFLCSLESEGVKPYNPKIVEGVHLENTFTPEVILALWLEKSAISRELYDRLSRENPRLIE
ncbi:hypothetical protein AMECASPLE_035073, partial [Ameca splendens]